MFFFVFEVFANFINWFKTYRIRSNFYLAGCLLNQTLVGVANLKKGGGLR